MHRGKSSDGLDEEIWRRLCLILAAAHTGDASRFAYEWLNLEKAVSSDQQRLAGVYVWYLLYYRVVEILGRRPVQDDLREIADRARRSYANLIRPDDHLLEETLSSVFAAHQPQIRGGRFFVSGSALVSALLDDPASQLEAMRGPLARWYADNADDLRELGILSMPTSPSAAAPKQADPDADRV